MRRAIPAEGFSLISGTRAPPKRMGTHLWVQLRGTPETATAGWADEFAPWPVSEVRWVHDGTAGDVVAIKEIE